MCILKISRQILLRDLMSRQEAKEVKHYKMYSTCQYHKAYPKRALDPNDPKVAAMIKQQNLLSRIYTNQLEYQTKDYFEKFPDDRVMAEQR